MLDNLKLIIAFVGLLMLVIGVVVTSLGFLIKVGFLLIGIWALMTVLTWKSNELSENLIALVIILIGGGLVFLYYGGILSELM